MLFTADFKAYVPGHVKGDMRYILDKYKPDFIMTRFKTSKLLPKRGYKYDDELNGWHNGRVFSDI